MKIAFLASHNGSSAKAITLACKDGLIPAQPSLLIASNSKANALLWGKDAGLETHIVAASTHEDVDQAIADLLTHHQIDLVICSGYMKLIGPKTIHAMQGRILNVHPALLPNYGGKGMYGRFVHQAVFDNKDTQTGVTIHMVDGEYDQGRIIAQKIVPVAPSHSVDDIENNVKAAEPDFYIETVQKILSGDITL
jgi:phosphoribosylglycinamide formyltransferase-1